MNISSRFRSTKARSRVLRPSQKLVNVELEVKTYRFEGLVVFLLSLCCNLLLAYGLTYIWHIGHGDAISRTANAYYVLYSREPHLAAVGFAWPPLPSLMQLPFIPIMKFFGNVAFSGNITSSIFGALSLLILNNLLAAQKFSAIKRWMLIAIVQFHPGTWYLFSAGMAEAMFLFFVLVVIYGMMQMPESMRSWVIVGIALAMAFFVRYESLSMIMAVALAVIIHLWGSSDEWVSKTEGWLLAILTPPIYGIALWVFFNWTLLGDPLYFYRSYYSYIGLFNESNTAKIAGLSHPLYLAWGNVIQAIKIGIQRSFILNPAYPPFAFFAGLAILMKKNRKSFGVFIVMISITAFTVLQVFLGSLANWLRYWFYAAPFGLLMAGIVNQSIQKKWRNWLFAVLVILSLASYPLQLNAMLDSNVSLDEQRFSALILNQPQYEELAAQDGYVIKLRDAPIVADVIDQYSENGLVLMDSSVGFAIIMAASHPERLYITNDTNYAKVLANPIGNVSYILALDPDTANAANTINLEYPNLFDKGADWATLVWDSGDSTQNHWRLYEIHPIVE